MKGAKKFADGTKFVLDRSNARSHSPGQNVAVPSGKMMMVNGGMMGLQQAYKVSKQKF